MTTRSKTIDFEICDPAISLCTDCAKSLKEGTCPKMKEVKKEKDTKRKEKSERKR